MPPPTNAAGLEEPGLFGGLDQMAAFFAERARGGVGLMVTGGIAPNVAGRVSPFAATMGSPSEARAHRVVTDAVHAEGGKIAMQILHAGRSVRAVDADITCLLRRANGRLATPHTPP